MHLRINPSWRYGVVGFYKDRKYSILRIYVPFIRISLYFGKARPSVKRENANSS